MGPDYNEKVFSVNIPSILHGVLVDAGSLRIKEKPFPVNSNPLKNLWFP
jgi:hypothetical protein